MFVVCVVWTIHEGQMERFLDAAHALAEASVETEPECFQYDVATAPERPQEVLFYEVYRSGDAHQRHREAPHLAAFRVAIEGCVESRTLTHWERQSGG